MDQLIYQNNEPIGGLMTMKGKAFLKKTLSWVDLKEGIEYSLQTWWDDQIYLGLRITEDKFTVQ